MTGMRAARRAWLTPAVSCLLASVLYVALGDSVALAIALWFCWCLTQASDADHLGMRWLGWFMLVAIVSATFARFALSGSISVG